MKKVLIIDATLGAQSRTLRLCTAYVEKYFSKDCSVSTVKLSEQKLAPLTAESLEKREILFKSEQTDGEAFAYAKDFATADALVIAAPYYDFSFPASVKVYIENIMVNGIVFRYGDKGPVGLCAAKELIYVTTAGGYIGSMNFGYDYIKMIAQVVGIPDTKCIAAEGLDIKENDAEEILKEVIAAL